MKTPNNSTIPPSLWQKAWNSLQQHLSNPPNLALASPDNLQKNAQNIWKKILGNLPYQQLQHHNFTYLLPHKYHPTSSPHTLIYIHTPPPPPPPPPLPTPALDLAFILPLQIQAFLHLSAIYNHSLNED
ncbi:MAG: hypothetical protein D6805_10435, partial [Planctomycetota bacterium]